MPIIVTLDESSKYLAIPNPIKPAEPVINIILFFVIIELIIWKYPPITNIFSGLLAVIHFSPSIKITSDSELNSKNKLSLIEINREDLESLPKLLNLIKNLKRQFILYCDDLSFEKGETKFKSLKSVLEGGIEGKPNNVVFYATSNIRHLISSNSTEMEQLNTVAQKDHLNETISLSDRFGLWIGFHNIDQNTYLEIINSYLKYFEIEDANNEIRENSLKWSIQRGSRSGRVAWQYIVDVAGKLEKKISF